MKPLVGSESNGSKLLDLKIRSVMRERRRDRILSQPSFAVKEANSRLTFSLLNNAFVNLS